MKKGRHILIKGARQHNLKNVSLQIPREKLVVFTGPSGCGKSSLVFYTLYAEGQRRYVESLSPYARQFLDQFDKPEVDKIEGLSPALAIQQQRGGSGGRSTVATLTEIHDYLRILFANVSIPYDEKTGEPLEIKTREEIIAEIQKRKWGTKVFLLSPLNLSLFKSASQLKEWGIRQGFVRVFIDDEIVDLENLHLVWKKKKPQKIELIVDRFILKEKIEFRLADSIELALRICPDELNVHFEYGGKIEIKSFLLSYYQPETGRRFSSFSPRHFSFNSPLGACITCSGLGVVKRCDSNLLIRDKELRIDDILQLWWAPLSVKKEIIQASMDFFKGWGFSFRKVFSELPASCRQLFLEGGKLPENVAKKSGLSDWKGLCSYVDDLYLVSRTRPRIRRNLARFMLSRICPCCKGKRLNSEVLSFQIRSGKNRFSISDFCELTIEDAYQVLEKIHFKNETQKKANRVVFQEIKKRLSFLQGLGLEYLSLHRLSSSLSGGEFQRIRLATQLGSKLSGVLYILDEPSIGLHPQDNHKLIQALYSLRDSDNTILVVEHDEELIRSADWVIDMGPGSGSKGGKVSFEGEVKDLEKSSSLTGKWLRNLKKQGFQNHRFGFSRLEVKKNHPCLKIIGAREHNLRDIDVEIPLGRIVCLTGPSGSGKTTLLDHILKKALNQHFYGSKEIAGKHRRIEGLENLDKVIVVDQSPLGSTSRSNAATYTKAFNIIRDLFAELPLSRERGYKAGRFSFNVDGGRCNQCSGDGYLTVDMHFLTDAQVLCDSCQGKRYNRETLEVLYKGKSIADVLEMSIEKAFHFFKAIPTIVPILQTLKDVGLGYLKLGQASSNLSGGEAQRVKLATELCKKAKNHTLYILDEPTTGLHFEDVAVFLKVLFRLRDAGHSIFIVEHHMGLVSIADWVIDMGPGGGVRGGEIMFSGVPEELVNCRKSPTGKWLKSNSSS